MEYRSHKAIVLVVALFCASAFATNYTICSSGCDDTSLQTFLSGTSLNAGDVVEVQADSPGGSKTIDGLVTLTSSHSGTSNNYVRIQGRAGDTITIDSHNTNANCILASTANWIELRGFNLTNFTNYGIMWWKNGFTGGGIKVVSNRINVGFTGFTPSAGNNLASVFLSGRGDNYNLATNIIFSWNTITTDTATNAANCDVDGLRITGAKDVIVSHNTITRSGAGTGGGHDDLMQFWDCTNLWIYGNRCVTLANWGIQQGIYVEGVTAGVNGEWAAWNNLIDMSRYTNESTVAFTFTPKNSTNQNFNLYLLANTIIGYTYPFYVQGGNTNNIYAWNNLLLNQRTTSPWYGLSVTSNGVHELDWNFYYRTNWSSGDFTVYGGASKTWPAWQALGFDSNSSTNSPWPLSSSWVPTSASLAKGFGTNLSSLAFPEITQDLNGLFRPTTPTVGAFEYDARRFIASSIIAGNATFRNSSSPPISYLVNQNFEGSGFDNGETWTTNTSGGTYLSSDPDSTSPAIVGSQSLRQITTNAYIQLLHYWGSTNTEVFGYCMINPITFPPASRRIMTFKSAAATEQAYVVLRPTGVIRTGVGGNFADTVGTMSLNTNVHVWFYYKAGSGSDGIINAAWSFTGIKPNSGNNFAGISNAASTTGVQLIGIGEYAGDGGGTMSNSWDRILVSTSPIGDNP